MRLTLFLILLLSLVSSNAQSLPTCKDLHSGIFYQYHNKTGTQYIISQNEGFEKDVDITTGDSSIYENKWLSDCVLSQKCISSTEKIITDNWKFVKKHRFIGEIIRITDSCAILNVYVDKVSDKPTANDTIWFNQRMNIAINPLFKQTTTERLANKNSAKDTAKYALVYIYRPFKIALSLGSYFDYCDGLPMCLMKNNTGYIFKIYKEGIHKFQSNLHKDIAGIDLDIHFGKIYYIKSSINWAITSRLYNYRLEMEKMDNITGEEEFLKVKEK